MKNILLTLSAFVFILLLTGSCATTHPNEKILVGTWKAVKVEKIVDTLNLSAKNISKKTPSRKNVTTPKSETQEIAYSKGMEALDRFVKNEMNSTMVISPDKTAIRTFRGREAKVTWKMKGKGTRVVIKNPELGKTYVMEILSINKEEIVALVSSPIADIKLTYKKIQ